MGPPRQRRPDRGLTQDTLIVSQSRGQSLRSWLARLATWDMMENLPWGALSRPPVPAQHLGSLVLGGAQLGPEKRELRGAQGFHKMLPGQGRTPMP